MVELLLCSEMLIELSDLHLNKLNLDNNPITTTAAKAFVRVLARGRNSEAAFQSEYVFDRELERAFDPLHMSLEFEQVKDVATAGETEPEKDPTPKLKLVPFDLADPFQRAQATVAVRCESSGFQIRSVRLQEDATPEAPLDRGGEEIDLERKCRSRGSLYQNIQEAFSGTLPGRTIRESRLQDPDAFLSVTGERSASGGAPQSMRYDDSAHRVCI